MIIIGIDPSLLNTGWGIISSEGSRLVYIASGTIKTKNNQNIQYRLEDIHDRLSEIILQYKPNSAAMEESFVNKNPSSSLKLAHARGAIMLTMAKLKLDLTEYAPTLVKKTVVGVGRAEKSQIEAMVRILLPRSTPDSEHAADALAVCICHSRYAKEK
ncbi:Crossover junction endodeoxyribonuclease RuvC [Candidatus Arcanobacter lacustris]|uniref:Crossover junction endodeoxyribonuclease RuvC n=1 Tax=Candidatus Arcanibacter lacustris TaxID=1607817 RepID=A0A0F5MNI5_9RICK|nr:Crossover junction endodeoxyribonuclease RuvC [Candidatus Arcanobacter lacustris]